MALILQKRPAHVEKTSGDAPLLSSIIEARGRTATLIGPGAIESTIDTMVTAARDLGRPSLRGASEVGHAIAGAMVYAAQDLRLWQPGEREPILLIDGVLAGLAGIEAAVERAQAVGAIRIAVLALDVLVAEREVRTTRGAVCVETPRWPHLAVA